MEVGVIWRLPCLICHNLLSPCSWITFELFDSLISSPPSLPLPPRSSFSLTLTPLLASQISLPLASLATQNLSHVCHRSDSVPILESFNSSLCLLSTAIRNVVFLLVPPSQCYCVQAHKVTNCTLQGHCFCRLY